VTRWTFRLQNMDTQAYLGDLLDYTSVKAGFEYSAVSSITCDYPLTGRFASLLDTDIEIIGLFDGVEQRNARWISRGLEGNTYDENGGKVTITGLSMIDLLRKVMVYASTTFAAQTPGAILKTLLQTASVRGAFGATAITTATFTNTLDSNGVAWSKVLNITYSPGGTYRQVVEQMVELGLIDFEFNGRDLKVYNGGTMGTTTSVALSAGAHVIETPFKESTEERANVILVEGDGGVLVERTVSGVRREESYAQQSGISNGATLAVVGDQLLASSSVVKTQKTIKIATGSSTVPFQNFLVGDFVIYDDGYNAPATNRVRQAALEIDTSGNDVYSLSLNDLILEADIRRAMQLQSLAGGISNATIGTPTTPPTIDTTIPSAPTGLSITSATYMESDGQIRGQVSAVWATVTTNTDATAIGDLDHYDVQFQASNSPLIPPGLWSSSASIPAGTTAAYFGPFVPGSSVTVRVRAVDTAGNASAWTTSAATTVISDSTGPVAPSTPSVVTQFRGIQVTWNGLDNLGNPMSADYHHVDLHVSTVNNFTPSVGTKIDTATTRGEVFSVQGLTYGTTYYAKLIAYDWTGNASAASTQGSATPQTLVSPDVPGLFITNAMVANAAIDDAKIATVSAGKITVGTLSADITVSSRIKTANTGARAELNSGGLQAFNSSGAQTVNISATDGAATIAGLFQTGLTGQRIVIDPGGTSPTFYYYPPTGSNYAYINAPAGVSGTIGSLGINSGNFPSPYNASKLVSTRAWMTDTGGYMQVIDNTQSTYGASITAGTDQVYMVTTDNVDVSYMQITKSTAYIVVNTGNTANPDGQLVLDSIQAKLQYSNSTAGGGYFYATSTSSVMGGFASTGVTPAQYTMDHTSGFVTMRGYMSDYVVANQYDLRFTGSILDNTSHTSITLSYGVTMAKPMNPVFTFSLSGSTLPTYKVQSSSTTGFTILKSIASAGLYLVDCYRCAS
jgi:hypothetical protein